MSITEPTIREAYETALRYAREDAAKEATSKPGRFLLFGFPHYYPAGGWNDYIGDFVTYEEAETELIRRFDAEQFSDDWIGGGHVIDRETGERLRSPKLQKRAILEAIKDSGKPNFKGFPDTGYWLHCGNYRIDTAPKFDTPAAGFAWLKETHGIEKP